MMSMETNRHVDFQGVQINTQTHSKRDEPNGSEMKRETGSSSAADLLRVELQEEESRAGPVGHSMSPEGKAMGMTRSRHTLFSLASSESSSASTAADSANADSTSANAEVQNSSSSSLEEFGQTVRIHTKGRPQSPVFDGLLRKSMEPHLKKARLLRENARKRTHLKVADSIASSIGVPYTALRHERPFLFDEHTNPLHLILSETLNVPDLARVHEFDQDTLLEPLLDRERRRAFHLAYDNFVTSFCIPLLHSLAIGKNIFHTASSDRITYRYQAFPSIQIVTPGSSSQGPVCDSVAGHSIGCLTFHIPLTPCFGTNALYVESHPGREDWHPLSAKAVGLGYLFDGTRCMHFPLDNTTSASRVSLSFRVLVYREGRLLGTGTGTGDGGDTTANGDGGLCPPELVEDGLSRAGPGYYDEALIDLNRSAIPGLQMITKKNGNRLLDPDHRVGPPFARST
jgi:hypothetical protein